MNKTVILFGGQSEERLVSVASAQNVVGNFQFDEILFLDKNSSLFTVTPTELMAHQNPFLNEFIPATACIAKSLSSGIAHLKNKTVFLCLHGTEGEDGQIQNLFEKNNIAFTGSASQSSRNSFNKNLSKAIVAKTKIKTTDEIVFTETEAETRKDEVVAFLKKNGKIVLKPVANGSSIGLYIVDQEPALLDALLKIKTAKLGDYLAESFIQGRELTVGVYQSPKGLMALPPSEVVVNSGRTFDYEGKYLGKGSTEITPAQLTQAEISMAQKMAIESHIALSCYGYSRTDLILTTNEVVFIETNTLPGLSRPSFIPQQLNVADIQFSEFIRRQIELAEARAR